MGLLQNLSSNFSGRIRFFALRGWGNSLVQISQQVLDWPVLLRRHWHLSSCCVDVESAGWARTSVVTSTLAFCFVSANSLPTSHMHDWYTRHRVVQGCSVYTFRYRAVFPDIPFPLYSDFVHGMKIIWNSSKRVFSLLHVVVNGTPYAASLASACIVASKLSPKKARIRAEVKFYLYRRRLFGYHPSIQIAFTWLSSHFQSIWISIWNRLTIEGCKANETSKFLDILRSWTILHRQYSNLSRSCCTLSLPRKIRVLAGLPQESCIS